MNEFDYIMDKINKTLYELDELVSVKGIYYDKTLLSSTSYCESYEEAILPQYKYIREILLFIDHFTNYNDRQFYVDKVYELKWEYFEAIIHVLTSVINSSFSIGYVTSMNERKRCHVTLKNIFDVFINISMFDIRMHKFLFDLSEFLGEYADKENEILEIHNRLQKDLSVSYNIGQRNPMIDMYYANTVMYEIFCDKPRKLRQEINVIRLDKEKIDMICKRYMSQKALMEISQQIKK